MSEEFHDRLLFYWDAIEQYKNKPEIQKYYIWRLKIELGVEYNA